MSNKLKLRIILIESKPQIWRRILVSEELTLRDLHKVIQTTMGWTNSHLHQFIIKNKRYGNPEFQEFDEPGFVDYSDVKIKKMFKNIEDAIIYEYDFGDGWEHSLLFEGTEEDESQKDAICLDGKNNCPPEDCGGVYGYQDLLKTINNPESDEYQEMMEWLGGDFDPEYFNKDEVNKALGKKDFGCIEIMY